MGRCVCFVEKWNRRDRAGQGFRNKPGGGPKLMRGSQQDDGPLLRWRDHWRPFYFILDWKHLHRSQGRGVLLIDSEKIDPGRAEAVPFPWFRGVPGRGCSTYGTVDPRMLVRVP